MYSLELESRIDKILHDRGISSTVHVSSNRFISDFKAYLCYYDCTTQGNAETTIELLKDKNNLTPCSVFKNNFRKSLDELIPTRLKDDPIFYALFKKLLSNKGKGVGIGELVLPLIIADYTFSNKSDGEWLNNKAEIKKDGASLKPIKTGLTKKGLVDDLVKEFFNGCPPGYVQKKQFNDHLDNVDPTVYSKFFSQLYPGCDTSRLAHEVEQCYTDAVKFNTAVGKFALREYQQVDKWTNILYIKEETFEVVNITNVDDIDDLNLKFTPKFCRGKDTQAIADGYVNVKI